MQWRRIEYQLRSTRGREIVPDLLLRYLGCLRTSDPRTVVAKKGARQHRQLRRSQRSRLKRLYRARGSDPMAQQPREFRHREGISSLMLA